MQGDLNKLRIFHTVYKENGVSKAAEKLHISQPAVSQHLQKLEKEIGVVLFTRLHKKLIPTSAGHQLFGAIDDFFGGLPGTLNALRYPAEMVYGVIKIGAPYEFGQKYLPEICHGFRQKYDNVQFSIRLGEPIPTLLLLKEGEIDFAIIDLVLAKNYLGGNADFYSIDPLIDEELTMICSRDYYDRCVMDDVTVDHLLSLDFISDEHDDMYIKHWFLHHYNVKASDFSVVMKVESHQASLACVKLGMGLTVTSSHMVWEDIQRGEIVAINSSVENAVNTMSLIQLQDKVPTNTEKKFHTYLKKVMLLEEMQEKFRSKR